MAIRWTDDLSCGDATIDAQHRELLTLYERLLLLQGQAHENLLDEAIEQLLAYTKGHFDAEERLMAHHIYPDLNTHCEKHRQIRLEIAQLRRRRQQGASIELSEMTDLVAFVVHQHMLVDDRRVTEWVNRN
jgi:hemerythrin